LSLPARFSPCGEWYLESLAVYSISSEITPEAARARLNGFVTKLMNLEDLEHGTQLRMTFEGKIRAIPCATRVFLPWDA
jgi:hypothetical protein